MKEFKGKSFRFELSRKTYIMGILNVTGDSFSDGGKYTEVEDAFAHAVSMQEDGADIIDIGAQSTAPGSTPIDANEEIRRLRRVLPIIVQALRIPVSVDTVHAETARFALQSGASIINDVSGVFNPDMARLVSEYGCGWIITHGMSADAVDCAEDMELLNGISGFFSSVYASCKSFGIDKSQLCFDVGIGFGKSRNGDFTVLRELKRIANPDFALMVGASRKRFIESVSRNTLPEERVSGTVAANTVAIGAGADILRVHDVKEAVQGARVADAVYRNGIKKCDEGIIRIRDLKIFAYHGVNPEEKIYGQNFLADLDIYTNFDNASDSDDIENTVSYAKVIKTVKSAMTDKKFDLIESAAKYVIDTLFVCYPSVNRLHLILKKPDAPMKSEFSYVGVEIDKCR